ncbi:hypothetical protein BpHYR1_016167 [Brachionus plicatilis]|nr:hypothetical protein BpHYR1_016167 [Brachionus plicatilis]
MSSILST